MVHNRVSGIKLPFRNNVISARSKQVIRGCGNGSVLLSKGGPGAASSYQDMDDYIRTVGYDRGKKRVMEGSGMSKSLESKLKGLTISSGVKKKGNIVM